MILDGDEVRMGLSADLKFNPDDRREQMRRVAWMARLLGDQGFPVLVSLASPYEKERLMAKEIIDKNGRAQRFVLIWVNTPLGVCKRRDTRGLYARAKTDPTYDPNAGYEPPSNPYYTIDATAPDAANKWGRQLAGDFTGALASGSGI